MMVPVCTPCRGSGLTVFRWFPVSVRWSGFLVPVCRGSVVPVWLCSGDLVPLFRSRSGGLVWRSGGLAVDPDSLRNCYDNYKTVTASSGWLTISDGAMWR